ncbi:MAG: hypothetical protein ABEJ77_02200 [Halanaeroarchaeum sp.]
MSIEYERSRQEATFYSPLEDFEETTVEVEVRVDPLTDRQTRLVPESFLVAEDPDIEAAVADDEDCFFCPDAVEDVTPEYPDFVGTERGSVGEATSFPNLHPYGSHSNVVVLTEEHFVPMEALGEDRLADGFAAALGYVERVFETDADAAVGSVNMNFLPSAGSSIVHPHMQTLVDDRGTNRQRRRLAALRAYHDRTGSRYVEDLLARERDGERYVGATGAVEWYAPFAPRHHRHVRGVLPTGLPSAADDAVSDLASGLTAVLESYAEAGLNSFNLGLHLAPGEQATRPVVDVVGRSVFDEYYWSDATFFETIHDEGVIDEAPEDYAGDVADRL